MNENILSQNVQVDSSEISEADVGLSPTACCASLIANTNQDEIDWNYFAGKFEAKYGFAPHRRDSGHQEYFHWFTVGAHAEFMGRLDSLHNNQDNLPTK